MVGIDRIFRAVRDTSTLMRIVWVNIGVFVMLRLTAIAGVFSGHPEWIDIVDKWLELPADFGVFLHRPWTLLTYMFTQWDLLHVAFNMLWLYWFATVFLTISTSGRLLSLYIAGGLGGALFFLAGSASLPSGVLGPGHYLLGSSAAVMAILTAVGLLMPHFRMMLFLLGSVELRWVALATIFLVLIGVTGENGGGEVAHLGGIAVGAAYGLCRRRGTDILAPLERLPSRLKEMFSRKTRSACTTDRPHSVPSGLTVEEREELDMILDKIKKSGYTSLTASERDRLFKVSRQIK